MLWLIVAWIACAADPCELALQRQKVAVRACGGTLEREGWHGQTCSGPEAELLGCEAACMEEADCRALVETNKDYIEMKSSVPEYYECIQSCPTPW